MTSKKIMILKMKFHLVFFQVIIISINNPEKEEFNINTNHIE